MNEAVRSGLKRAGFHLIKAGYEVVAGLGAFVEELNRARRSAESGGDDTTPTRIEVE